MRTFSASKETKAFLKAIRTKRRELKLPQKVLAHEYGVCVATYSNIENGAREINLDFVIFAAKRLNIQLDQVINLQS